VLIMIALYCLAVAIFVVALTLRAEVYEEERRRKKRPLAPVINIEDGRQRLGQIHKHA
jgi:hypothetical protein